MKNKILTIIFGILLISLVSADVIKVEPQILEQLSTYSGESITRDITIKTDGNYIVYLDYKFFNNTYDMQGFNIDIPKSIYIEREKTITITIFTDQRFRSDSFNIIIIASTEKAEEIFEEEFIQNETTEINNLTLDIDSNGTGNIVIKTFKENPEKGFSIPSLNLFFEIEASDSIIEGMNKTLIKVYYTDSELGDIDESTLRLYFFNETLNNWQGKYGGVNISGNYVWVETDHFSLWGIFGNRLIEDEEEDEITTDGGCITTWGCGEWGNCIEGNKTRNCSKVKSYCYARLKDKPIEVMKCEIQKDIEEETSKEKSNFIKDNLKIVIVISLLLLISISYMWYRALKNKKLNKK